MKKLLLLFAIIFITGCMPKDISVLYKSIKNKNYSMNLTYYGTINDNRYGNEIKYDLSDKKELYISEKKVDASNNIYYQNYLIKNKKTYEYNGSEYIKSDQNYEFQNHSIFLDGLKHISEKKVLEKQIYNGKLNEVYEVTFKTSFFNKLLKELNIPTISNEEIVKGKIYYLDKQLNKIVYTLNSDFLLMVEYEI